MEKVEIIIKIMENLTTEIQEAPKQQKEYREEMKELKKQYEKIK